MKAIVTYLGIILLICSCSLEEYDMNMVGGEQIEFTSSKTRIITKGGDEAQTFETGTAFRLFAVTSGSDWSMNGTKLYNIEGIGEEDGKVGYSIDGKLASYDVGSNLDFYGVTYGSATAVPVNGTAGTAPTVPVSIHEGELPDLMYSDNLKNRNSSSGLLNLEFRHTLAKLKFEVLKQDESADIDKKLEKVVLKKVVLKGSAAEGEFNMKTSEWAYADADKADRTVFESNEGLKVEPTVSRLQENGKDIEMLVIPNSSQMSLEVTLDLDGDASTPDDKTVTYDLTSDENVPLKVEANHEYVLSIVILKNDVRIVTVTPKVYDWIDVNVDNSAYLGQPVFFGGLMWMDRNLGAQSADCKNDWLNSLGYYYQFGRNIPYILDVEAYKAASNKSFTFAKNGYDSLDPDAVWNMKFLYTIDNNGNRITTVKHANHSSGSCLYGNVAITPGDQGDYSYIRGFIYKTSGGTVTLDSRTWAKKDLDFVRTDDSQVVEGMDNHIFWETIENQPCPRGWRIPGKADMYSFMPESTKLFWLDSYKKGDDMTEKSTDVNANYMAGNTNSAGEKYNWKYFAGKFKVDPSADKSAEFSYPQSNGSYGMVYGIKYEGEDKAYRVMFEQLSSTSGSDLRYVRISRFQAESADRFKISSDGKQWNLHQFDWSTPVEYMDIPLAGFMYESGMSDFGAGAILRAKEGDGFGTNWTLYLRSGHNGVAVAGNSRRLLGENIRCVRDVNAK